MASVSVLNSIGTVVHSAPDKAVSVLSSLGTVVHDAPVTLDAVSVLGSFGTVVHNTPPPLQAVSVQNMLGTTVHDSTFVFNVADITGTVGTPATFDASTQGLPVADYAHEWSWTSVPGGSSYANQSIPFPDNSVNTYFDMTDNELLVHMDGDSIDYSGNGRNGNVFGAGQVTGRVGSGAFFFNNPIPTGPDYIDFGANLRYTTQDFTFALWVKPEPSQPNAYCAVFSCHQPGTTGTGYFMQQNASNTNQYTFIGNNGTSWGTITDTFTLAANVWSHVIFVRTGTRVVAYVNGVEVYDSPASSANPIGYGASSPNFTIGGVTGQGAWNGAVDEFASWTRALSADEVHDLFFLQSGSAASGSAPGTNLDDEFTFTPDVAGTYTMNLSFYQYSNGLSATGSVDAVITSGPSPTPVITGSNPTVNLVSAGDAGYVLNTYRIQNLSVQRSRTSEQVPFKIGTKGRQSLRLRTNTEFTGSS